MADLIYYTDEQVARLLDPSGTRIKPRSIRAEREKGRLVGTRVAGKWLYRESDLLAFLDAARCPAPTLAPGSSSSATPDGPEPDISSDGPRAAEPAASEQVAMPAILLALRDTSSDGSESAPRRGRPAQVIPLMSGSQR